MARCFYATARKILRQSPTVTGRRLVDRSLMTNSSFGTRGLRGFIGFMARSDSIRPNRIIPSRSPSVPCRTNQRLQVRERMKRAGLNPFSLPLGVDIEAWLKRAPTPWDAFPDTGTGKMDAESCGLAEALRYPNVALRENVKVERLVLDSDGKRLAGVEASVSGERKRILARTVIRSAGAVNSAALLLASGDEGIANRSDAVGRNFMNHNCSAVLAIDPGPSMTRSIRKLWASTTFT
jgi:choline dehydrogenase-like flavoprotein